jgi:pimeloyl-ACP methyl ester carboxylesterase
MFFKLGDAMKFKIGSLFEIYGLRWPMLLMAAAAQAAPARPGDQPLALETAGGSVHGSLRLPAGEGKAPVVLIVAGSGPTDRDGNSAMIPGHNDSLKMLAEALAQAGFASVRYDKRGIGASKAAAPDESQLRFDTYVEDAAAWIAQLKADPRFRSVAVIGHSEGALIGMLAAERAGAAPTCRWPAWPRGRAPSCAPSFAGKLPPPLASRQRTHPRQPGAGQACRRGAARADGVVPAQRPALHDLVDEVRAGAHIATLRMPVLIVQGTTDIQVGVEQAQALEGGAAGCRLVHHSRHEPCAEGGAGGCGESDRVVWGSFLGAASAAGAGGRRLPEDRALACNAALSRPRGGGDPRFCVVRTQTPTE